MYRVDANGDGDFTDAADKTYFQLTDTLGSVIALLNPAGGVIQRTTYDAYGRARAFRPADLNGDGIVDDLDHGILMASWSPTHTHVHIADLNRDGMIDDLDMAILQADFVPGAPPGQIALPGIEMTIGYAGYIFNPELQIYSVGFRHYDPVLGRWLQRDPAGYVDGMSLYLYVMGNPMLRLDPLGLAAWYEYLWEGTKGVGQGLLDGAAMIGNAVTLHAIDPLDQYVDNAMANRGDWSYDVANASAHAGVAAIELASGVELVQGAWAAVNGLSAAAAASSASGELALASVSVGEAVGQGALASAEALTGVAAAGLSGATLGKGAGDVLETTRAARTGRGESKCTDENTLPELDSTGKVHGRLPEADELERYSPEELRQLQEELRQSVQRRIEVTVKKGSDFGHGERQAAEQQLIKSIEKHLRDR